MGSTQSQPESDPVEDPLATALARRVLIIGLDGATFDVLNPLMERGLMPRLKAAVDAGASGTLFSTVPPVTPAAWTTFLTGRNPGAHGAVDFEYYDVHTGRLHMHSARSLARVRNLWRILSDAGLKVGSVHVPMTYPPAPVNGFVISGFETPGPHSDFAYPPDLRREVLARWPDPTLRKKWKRRWYGGEKTFDRNIDYVARSFQQGTDMTLSLGDRFGWDALMVVFKFVDNLQHKAWKHIDPRWADRRPRRRDRVHQCFAELDQAIGRLLDYAAGRDAAVLIVSDHGHGALEGKVYPNLLLRQWGYLRTRPGTSPWMTRLQRSLGGHRAAPPGATAAGIERHLPVDLAHTRACVMHGGNGGFLYINLKGRQPTGIVEPAAYEALRDELRRRLLAFQAVDPAGRTFPVFPEIHKPEELYDRPRAEQPWMPDLLLIQHDGLAVARRIRGRRPVEWLPYRRIEGTHRKEGILIVCGPGIARTREVQANIVDCAPTLLAYLGLPIPQDMDGRVIDEVFCEPPAVEMERMAPAATMTPASDAARGADVYSAQELQEVTDRLADLGYLE